MRQCEKRAEKCLDRETPDDWAALILKLRWIGLDEEATRLEAALQTVPREDRGSVSIGPFNTD